MKYLKVELKNEWVYSESRDKEEAMALRDRDKIPNSWGYLLLDHLKWGNKFSFTSDNLIFHHLQTKNSDLYQGVHRYVLEPS